MDAEEDGINEIAEEISNGTYGGTENFDSRAGRIRSGKRSDTGDYTFPENRRKAMGDDRLSAGQSAGDTDRHSYEAGGNSPTEEINTTKKNPKTRFSTTSGTPSQQTDPKTQSFLTESLKNAP